MTFSETYPRLTALSRLAAALTLACMLSACGGDDDDSPPETPTQPGEPGSPTEPGTPEPAPQLRCAP